METIETARLTLRRPVPADVHPLAEINADPEVRKYIGDGRVGTFERTAEGYRACDPGMGAEGIARAIREWDERRYGMFSVDRRDTGEFIGWVALTEPPSAHAGSTRSSASGTCGTTPHGG